VNRMRAIASILTGYKRTVDLRGFRPHTPAAVAQEHPHSEIGGAPAVPFN